jgi:hypothetical protein
MSRMIFEQQFLFNLYIVESPTLDHTTGSNTGVLYPLTTLQSISGQYTLSTLIFFFINY